MNNVLLKSAAWWLAFIPAAIMNGILRESVLSPALGAETALPVSGVTLSLLILLITWFIVPNLKTNKPAHFWQTGILWLILTIAFEFSFGYLVGGKSWNELFKAYNILSGNLWLVVLVTTFFAPYPIARLRKII